MKIAIIGAGNGGQAIAAYLASKGAEVRLYDYDKAKMLLDYNAIRRQEADEKAKRLAKRLINEEENLSDSLKKYL